MRRAAAIRGARPVTLIPGDGVGPEVIERGGRP